MGTAKKEKSRKDRQGKVGDGMNNVKTKGENFYRTAKQARTLNMFNEGKAQRNASGKITKAASYQSRERPKAMVEPNRKWFGNTRVISQDALSHFREAMAERAKDPYQVLLKSNKLPMSLVRDNETKNGLKQHAAKIQVQSAPFQDTFGPKAQRKRVKLSVGCMQEMAGESGRMHQQYLERQEQARQTGGLLQEYDEPVGEALPEAPMLSTAQEPIFSKGQSRRIWNELYKVIDSSDVLLHILDARDPVGTRCRSVEKYIKEEAPHKHLVFVLNKTDLVPVKVAAAWVRHLSKEYPTLAFHASITNSFGKGSLITLLRQFSSLHSSRKQISVGFIGYPNTGKSSIINTLRKKAVCTVAPVPGETKVWQYITLMKRIYLIDCPGVVPPNQGDTPEDILLRGVVRVENVDNPEQYIPAVLNRVKVRHVERTYNIENYTSPTDLLERLARKGGRLLKGGEADVNGVAKMVLNDFLRGKLPWFTPPPLLEGQEENINEETGIVGRQGALGEMGYIDITKLDPNKEEHTIMEDCDKDDSLVKNGDIAQSSDDYENDEDIFEGFDVHEDIELDASTSDDSSSTNESQPELT